MFYPYPQNGLIYCLFSVRTVAIVIIIALMVITNAWLFGVSVSNLILKVKLKCCSFSCYCCFRLLNLMHEIIFSENCIYLLNIFSENLKHVLTPLLWLFTLHLFFFFSLPFLVYVSCACLFSFLYLFLCF